MNFTSKLSVTLHHNNRHITLNKEQITALINTLIRNNSIEFDITDMPERYDNMLCHAAYAYEDVADSGDDRIYVHIDCDEGMIMAHPRDCKKHGTPDAQPPVTEGSEFATDSEVVND